ncbi:MAG TPA: hypothetical protein VEX60_06685 [Pyrinomonadaceae bacterium]|nr:hypothetical protein [Pyrinomonadaceae bacterium]
MRNRLSKIFLTLAVLSLAALALAPGADAQRRRSPRARGYTKAEVDAVIRHVENRSDEFVRQFDRALDRSGLDGTRREDNLNEQAKKLERTLDDLRREFDRKESYVETRPEVRRTLDIAADINKTMRRRRMGGETERQWATLRSELNTLANVYGLSAIR